MLKSQLLLKLKSNFNTDITFKNNEKIFVQELNNIAQFLKQLKLLIKNVINYYLVFK